jgi:hypothetical protein
MSYSPIQRGGNVPAVTVKCHIDCDACCPVLTLTSTLPLPSHPSTMFNNSAGFQFHGGTFYNVSGDVHLQAHQHLTIQGGQGHNPQEAALQLPAGSPMALDDGSAEASAHELPGMARNRRHPRPAPYGAFKFASRRRYILYPQICLFGHVFPQAPPILKSTQDRYHRPRAR